MQIEYGNIQAPSKIAGKDRAEDMSGEISGHRADAASRMIRGA
jgi:hypothetical protein